MLHKVVLAAFFVWIQCLTFGQESSLIQEATSLSYNEIIGDLKGKEVLLTDALQLAEKKNDLTAQAIIHEKLALVKYYLKDLESGLKHSLDAVAMYEESGNINKVAEIYSDLGFAIKEVQLERGVEYFRMAIHLSKVNNFGKDNIKLYNNYGTLLSLSGDLDSALYYHLKSLEVCKDYKDTQAMPYSLNNAAVVYSQLGDFERAFELLEESDDIRRLENNDLSWGDNLAYRADLYYEQGTYDSAIKYYDQALVLAKKSKFVNLISFSLLRLSESYEKVNNTERSLFYFKELQHHKDSIVDLETNKAIAALQEEFNAAVKEKTITEQLLQIQQQNQRIAYFIIAVITLLFLIVVVIFFQFRKRREERIHFEHQQILEKAKAEKELFEEKLRIGRELHDNIGSQLTFMISSLDNLTYGEKEEGKREKMDRIGSFGRQTMKELRATIWAMKEDGGNVESLVLKINELKVSIKDHLVVEVIDKVEAEHKLNALSMLNLFRIVQEAIQNTIKYAEASKVKIVFENFEDHLILTIQDNGKGFDFEKLRFAGNGLSNMKKRCEDCNGIFTVLSSKDGTTIKCELKW